MHGRYRLSRPTVFALLMCLALIALFLPRRWTDGLKHVVQLMVPAQDMAYTAAHAAARSASALDPKRSASADAAHEQLVQSIASQAALIEQLEAQTRRLSALRRDHLDVHVPLLAAHVVSLDVVAWRDSLLVARGSTGGVAYRDWVTARLFADRGFASDVADHQPVLATHGLIGRVEQVSPYLCRIQLLTDVNAPRIEVRIAHLDHGAARMIDYPCSIRGIGKGRMAIEDIDYRWIEGAAPADSPNETGRPLGDRMAEGDLVYTAPGALGLPRPVVVGRIVSLTENPRRRLVYAAQIAPMQPMDDVREVYIVPLTPTASLQVPN